MATATRSCRRDVADPCPVLRTVCGTPSCRITLRNDSLHIYQWVPDAEIDLRGNQLAFYNDQQCEEARSWKVEAGQTERVWLYSRIAP